MDTPKDALNLNTSHTTSSKDLFSTPLKILPFGLSHSPQNSKTTSLPQNSLNLFWGKKQTRLALRKNERIHGHTKKKKPKWGVKTTKKMVPIKRNKT